LKRQSIIIGTRSSKLALVQAREIQEKLENNLREAGPDVRLKEIETTGDRILDRPLARIEGKGVFLKEIEKALLAEEIDMAVHSLKDVPTDMPEDLRLAALPLRADPRDVLVAPGFGSLEELPEGAVLGTGSSRRRTQLLSRRPDLEVKPVRGNVDTRLEKLHSEDYDGLVLAAAGLIRLGREEAVSAYLPPRRFLPAAGQGGLALEIRRDDKKLAEKLQELEDGDTACCLRAERALLSALGGGCHVPIGCYADTVRGEGGLIEITGMVGDGEGGKSYRETMQGSRDKAEETARELAEKLLQRGAGELLEEEE